MAGAFKQIQETTESSHARIVTKNCAPTNAPVGHLANHSVWHDDRPGKCRNTRDHNQGKKTQDLGHVTSWA